LVPNTNICKEQSLETLYTPIYIYSLKVA
jgi:hypothetical protein